MGGGKGASYSSIRGERGWWASAGTDVFGDWSFPFLGLDLYRVAGVGGLADPDDSTSSSISREGIESYESDRSVDRAAIVLPLVTLHASASES